MVLVDSIDVIEAHFEYVSIDTELVDNFFATEYKILIHNSEIGEPNIPGGEGGPPPPPPFLPRFFPPFFPFNFPFLPPNFTPPPPPPPPTASPENVTQVNVVVGGVTYTNIKEVQVYQAGNPPTLIKVFDRALFGVKKLKVD
jgi:hypothetical protein